VRTALQPADRMAFIRRRRDRQSCASLPHIRRQSSQLHGNHDTQSSVIRTFTFRKSTDSMANKYCCRV